MKRIKANQAIVFIARLSLHIFHKNIDPRQYVCMGQQLRGLAQAHSFSYNARLIYVLSFVALPHHNPYYCHRACVMVAQTVSCDPTGYCLDRFVRSCCPLLDVRTPLAAFVGWNKLCLGDWPLVHGCPVKLLVASAEDMMTFVMCVPCISNLPYQNRESSLFPRHM